MSLFLHVFLLPLVEAALFKGQHFHRMREAGQATVEYVVVVLAASLLAGLFIKWVSGTGKIGQLLDRVLDVIIGTIS